MIYPQTFVCPHCFAALGAYADGDVPNHGAAAFCYLCGHFSLFLHNPYVPGSMYVRLPTAEEMRELAERDPGVAITHEIWEAHVHHAPPGWRAQPKELARIIRQRLVPA